MLTWLDNRYIKLFNSIAIIEPMIKDVKVDTTRVP